MPAPSSESRRGSVPAARIRSLTTFEAAIALGAALFLSVLCAPSLSRAQCAPAPSDMVSWWAGEGDASDSMDGNDGVLLDGVGFAPGMVGQAFQFDGDNDRDSIPHAPNQNLDSRFTVDAWVNPSSSGHGRPVLQKRTPGNTGGFTFETTHEPSGANNGLQFGVWSTGGFALATTPADVLSLQVWHHVAATYDGSMMRIFVDGVESGAAPLLGEILSSSEPLVIGRNVVIPSFSWHGLIDEVHLFHRALSAAEILAIHQAGAAGICPAATGIAASPALGGGIVLAQNYPNPFRGDTVLHFELPASSEVRLDVVDVTGRLVRSLVHGPASAGTHAVSWDGRDGHGANAAAGVYALRLQAPGTVLTRKMIIVQ